SSPRLTCSRRACPAAERSLLVGSAVRRTLAIATSRRVRSVDPHLARPPRPCRVPALWTAIRAWPLVVPLIETAGHDEAQPRRDRGRRRRGRGPRHRASMVAGGIVAALAGRLPDLGPPPAAVGRLPPGAPPPAP